MQNGEFRICVLSRTQLQVKLLGVVLLAGLASSMGQAAEPISKWDTGILQLELRDVHVREKSVSDTCTTLSPLTGIMFITYNNHQHLATTVQKRKEALAQLMVPGSCSKASAVLGNVSNMSRMR